MNCWRKKDNLYRNFHETKKSNRRNNTLKKYIISALCLSAITAAGCGGTTNINVNAPAANNTTANKSANLNTNTAASTPKSAESPAAAKVDFSGNWDSEQYDKKGNEHTELSLFIEQKGETISGTYSVVGFVGKEPQVEDGNQTPFVGTIKDGVASIKFDADATVAGYEENVKYKEPANGKPSTATLTISGDKLQWKMSGGDDSKGLPKEISLGKAGKR